MSDEDERGRDLIIVQVRKLWESGRYPDWEHRGPGDCYGAEHLTRMLGISPTSYLPTEPSLITCSQHARTHSPNQHGRPIRRAPERRDQQVLCLARPQQLKVLRRQVREAERRVH
jgi:hypothetical protein